MIYCKHVFPYILCLSVSAAFVGPSAAVDYNLDPCTEAFYKFGDARIAAVTAADNCNLGEAAAHRDAANKAALNVADATRKAQERFEAEKLNESRLRNDIEVAEAAVDKADALLKSAQAEYDNVEKQCYVVGPELQAAWRASDEAERNRFKTKEAVFEAKSYVEIAERDLENAPEALKTNAVTILARAKDRYNQALNAAGAAKFESDRADSIARAKKSELELLNQKLKEIALSMRNLRESLAGDNILRKEAWQALDDHERRLANLSKTMLACRQESEQAREEMATVLLHFAEAVKRCYETYVTVDRVNNLLGHNPWNAGDPMGGVMLKPSGCANAYSFTPWSDCKNGMMTRTGTSTDPVKCPLTQDMMLKTCDSKCSYTYSDWSECKNGKQTRVVMSTYPQGCTVGTPETERPCTVTPVSCFHNGTFGNCVGNCGVGGPLNISVTGSTVNVSPLGSNGAQSFSIFGDTATSNNTNLEVLGAKPHTCTINCAGLLHCQRTNNAGIQCNTQCGYQ